MNPLRKRKARFRATVNGMEWLFVWHPDEKKLTMRRKFQKESTECYLTGHELVQEGTKQLRLL